MVAVELPREAEQNELWRRVDWRFLLPTPYPTNSVCFTEGSLAEGVAQVSDCTLTPANVAPEACDLAVAVDPDQVTLDASFTALCPGGSLYTEWYSPLAGGVQGVRRRLEAAGYEVGACYWPWPWPTHGTPAVWLPLDAPGALRYFLDERPRARPLVQRLGYAALCHVWRAGRWLGLTLPVCAVARKPTYSSEDTRPSILDTVHASWERWHLGPRPERLSWLLLTGGDHSTNKVVGLIFAEPDPRPQLVVKLARTPDSAPSLMREALALHAVHASRSEGIPGVPRALFHGTYGGVTALGETILTGVPLYTQVDQDSYRRLALQATDWLANLAGRQEPKPRSVWWSRLVEPVLAEFRRNFGPALQPDTIAKTRTILQTMNRLPLVCEQRDFAPWNVLIAPSGELVVLDWESAEIEGLPALDLLYFLTYLGFFLDGAMESRRFLASYRKMQNPLTLTGRVFAECLTRYCRRTDLDPEAQRALRLFVWLLHSRSEYRRLVADVGGIPSPELLRSSLFVRLWQEELYRGSRI